MKIFITFLLTFLMAGPVLAMENEKEKAAEIEALIMELTLETLEDMKQTRLTQEKEKAAEIQALIKLGLEAIEQMKKTRLTLTEFYCLIKLQNESDQRAYNSRRPDRNRYPPFDSAIERCVKKKMNQ